jgi:tetratricopeptide (TPR) repeat protein
MNSSVRLPYPGLRAYAHDETDLFFGREGCVNEMIDRLAATHFLAVLGASGSGKSSLVRTGLLDGLDLGLYRVAGPLWVVADCHPGGRAIRHLAAALLAARADGGGEAFALDALDTFLHRGPRAIVEWVTDGNLPDGHNLLLLVDQFEELFRYGDYAGREEAEAFVTLLLESATGHPRIHVVITMRSEYLGACALIPGLAERINASLYLTRRMSREECRQAIVGPAGVMGFDIEAELVTKLLNDLSALAPWEADSATSQLQRLSRQADQLPLMQHALSRLWQLARRRGGQTRLTLTLQDYLDIGQLRGALDQHAGEIMAKLSEPARAAVPRIFRALVSGATLADAVRRPMRFAALCSITGVDPALVRAVVAAFRARDCNFLRPPEEHPLTEDTIVDVSHESLIRQWTSLAGWFEAEAAAQALWGRLLYDERRHARGQGELLDGLDLATALAWWEREQPTAAWSAAYGGRYDELHRYLQSSRAFEQDRTRAAQARDERERRGLKRRAAAFAGLALISVAGAGWAYLDNIRLDRAHRELAGANSQLLQSTRAAQAALASKTEALAATQVANDRVITTADRFVVGLAEKLLVTPGISSDEVLKQLQDGQQYLDQLATQTDNKRLMRLTQAKFAAAGARNMLDRARFEQGLKLARSGESLLQQNGATGGFTRDETLEELEIGSLIAQFFDRDALNNLDAARSEARAMIRIADALPGDAGAKELLEQARAHYQLAIYIQNANDPQAVAESTHCLQLLHRLGAVESADRWFYEGRCHLNLGVFYQAQNKNPQDSVRETSLAIQLFDRIPQSQKTIPMLVSHSRALANLGFDHLQTKEYDQARALFMRAEAMIELTPLDLNERPKLRAELLDRDTEIGISFADAGNHKEAIRWYQKARDLGFIDAAWHDYPYLANRLDAALDNYQVSLGGLPWDKDADILAEKATVHRDRLNVMQRLLELRKADCSACELVEQESLFTALIKFDQVRKEDRYHEAMELAAEIVAKAKSILARPASARHAINARRAWFWTVDALPSGPEEIPSANSPQEQLERLQRSRTMTEEFLAQFPRAWVARNHLGQIDKSVATILTGLGRTADSVSTLEAGAKLFNKESIQLLAAWYRTGAGPVGRDLAKADRYDALLASRSWSMKRFTIPVTGSWLDNKQTFPYFIYIEDPTSPDDDFVARLVYQAEFIEGVKLPDAVTTSFEKLLKIARENKVSFVDLTVYALSPSDQLAVETKDAIGKNDLAGVATRLAAAWDRTGGADTVKDALAKLIKENPGTDFLPALASIAQLTLGRGKLPVTQALLDAIMEKNNLKADQLAAVVAMRAGVRERLGNPLGAAADFTIAVALRPNDAKLLTLQALSWINVSQNTSAAIALLERATELAPQDATIRASLGWAHVQAGDTEAGLALLEAAAVAQPAQPWILAHLGETYRRLGRRVDARATFERAAALSKDDEITAFIRHQQALL